MFAEQISVRSMKRRFPVRIVVDRDTLGGTLSLRPVDFVAYDARRRVSSDVYDFGNGVALVVGYGAGYGDIFPPVWDCRKVAAVAAQILNHETEYHRIKPLLHETAQSFVARYHNHFTEWHDIQ